MMRALLLFLALSFNFAFGQSINCKEVLNKKPNYLTESSEPIKSRLAEDIKIFKHCGDFTDADSLLFNGPIFGALMVKLFNQRETLTYGKIIAILQAIKNDSAYKNLLLAERSEKVNSGTTKKIEEFKPFISLENALAAAKKDNKKLLLFFSAHTDVNSERMKEDVFMDAEVKNALKKNFMPFKAYVDEMKELPVKEQYFSKVLNKQVITIGQKFLDVQLSRFKSSMCPHFIIIDINGKVIKQKIGYQDKQKFLSFIKIK